MPRKKEVKSNTRPDPVVPNGGTSIIPGAVVALAFQVKQWAQGFSGLNCDGNLISEPAEVGFVNLRYGFSQMGKVKEKHVVIIREILEDFESRLRSWEEFLDLEKSFVEKIEADDEKVKMYYNTPMPPHSVSEETVGVLPFVHHG